MSNLPDKTPIPTDEIGALCEKVGLKPTPLSEIDAFATPPGAALWSSDYACVLLWPVAEQGGLALQDALGKAEGYFDELLVEREAGNRTIDGYLILALPFEPLDEMAELVSRAELSTQFCRKHLIWPNKNEEGKTVWPRIAAITVLALPDTSDFGPSDVYWPQLGKEASKLWNELEGQNPIALAQQHGSG